jgi:hypothetical protein
MHELPVSQHGLFEDAACHLDGIHSTIHSSVVPFEMMLTVFYQLSFDALVS